MTTDTPEGDRVAWIDAYLRDEDRAGLRWVEGMKKHADRVLGSDPAWGAWALLQSFMAGVAWHKDNTQKPVAPEKHSPTSYIVCTSGTLPDFMNKISSYLSEGWQCVGGVSVLCVNPKVKLWVYSQALIKRVV